MTVTVAAVGKLKEKHYADACAEYVKRLGAFCKIELVELPEARLPANPSPAELVAALRIEAAAITAALPQNTSLVTLCIEGKPLSSEAFAATLNGMALNGTSRVAFIIGGSNGLDESIKSRAELRLSMSTMTFPHHLARVMLLEQLYRAFSINAGGKYHK